MRQIVEKETIDYGWKIKTVEKIKDEYFLDTNAHAVTLEGANIARTEKNDCVVRAFMMALDLTYAQAHKWVKKNLNRVDKKGTYTSLYIKNVLGKVKNGYRLKPMGVHPKREFMKEKLGNKLLVNPKYKKQTGFTVKSFLEAHPEGNYFLIVDGHALAVVDGVLCGNRNEQYQKLYRSVWWAVKCVKK